MFDQYWLKEEFKDLNNVIFLNVSYAAVPPRSVQEAYFGFTKDCIRTYGDDILSRAQKIIDNTRNDMAHLIGADSSEIAFVKNTAEGIGIIASGYSFKPGDNVVVPDIEHASNLYAWVNLQRKGIDLRIVPCSDDEIDIRDIINKCDSRTKAIAISAVQFSTGFYVDLYELGQYCKKQGILLVVDGIQAVGRLNINVQDMNIDYLACGGNKGLLSTFGAGFVYCSKRIVESIYPPYASYQSVDIDWKDPTVASDYSKLNWYKDARRLESGNLNYAGIAALQAGVELLNKLGVNNIESHILNLEDLFREAISVLPLNIKNPPKKNRSGVIFVQFPKGAENKVKDILRQYQIHATVRDGYIRLGINFYNTKDQMMFVVEAMKQISMLKN